MHYALIILTSIINTNKLDALNSKALDFPIIWDYRDTQDFSLPELAPDEEALILAPLTENFDQEIFEWKHLVRSHGLTILHSEIHHEWDHQLQRYLILVVANNNFPITEIVPDAPHS